MSGEHARDLPAASAPTEPDGPGVPLLVIGGPTATGKTALALAVADRVPAEIVSADSMAVYQGMDIGTAKPTPEERRRARFHLLDLIPPEEPYTLARFLTDASAAIEDVVARGRLPILCGGTGLYVRALLHGFSLPRTQYAEATALRERLLARLAREGIEPLIGELLAADPAAARQVELRNPRRVLRALEIVTLTGRPLAESRGLSQRPSRRYRHESYGLLCPRPVLYRRLEDRVDRMLAAGWVDEVRGLLARLRPGCTALQALGYRHLAAHLRGEQTLDEAIRRTKRDTRRFAKRQVTWWKREPSLRWLPWETPADLAAAALVLTRAARRLLYGPDR